MVHEDELYTVKLVDEVFVLDGTAVQKLQRKAKKLQVVTEPIDTLANDVLAMLDELQSEEAVEDANIYAPYKCYKDSYYISYSELLDSLRANYPGLSSKRLTQVLDNQGLQTFWDTNYRLYSKKAMRWIKV